MRIKQFCVSITLLYLLGIRFSSAEDRLLPPSEWSDLGGNDLSAALAKSNSPVNYATQYDGSNGLYEIFKLTDGNTERDCYINYFSSTTITYGVEGGAPDNFELLTIVSPHWWNAVTPNYTSVSRDLYNLIPSPEGISSVIGDAPPGIVETEEASPLSGIKWKAGIGRIGLTQIRLWEPPEELKGDVARCLMYLATIYPEGIRRYETGGGVVWAENPEDGFTSAYAAQLMVWHRSDPPSISELRRNEIYSMIQGNRNPFVDFPEVAEYLWGTRIGETYLGNTTGISSTDDTTPLKAIYLLTESIINLRSPSIPDDAEWTVDGIVVEGDFLLPKELGIGLHTLRFYSKDCHGVVKIEIK